MSSTGSEHMTSQVNQEKSKKLKQVGGGTCTSFHKLKKNINKYTNGNNDCGAPNIKWMEPYK
jgi:predicted amino acid racemase